MAFVVTAVVTAFEIGTVVAIATAVAEVGMAMSVVGAVTGNKTLTKWGGYLGLAGGVVALGAAAFGALSGSAAGAVGEAAVGAVGESAAAVGEEVAKSYAVDLGLNGADEIVSSAFNSAGASAGELSMLDPSGLGAQVAGSGVNSASNLAASSNINSAGNLASASNIAATPSIASPVNEAAKAATSTAGESYSAAYSGKPLYGANGTTNITSGLGSTSSSGGNWLKDWWGSLDPSTKNAAMSATGKVAEGLFAGWSAEQRNDFEKEKWNLMQSNANAQPVMTFKRPGLINSKG